MNEEHRKELIQYRFKRSQETFQEVEILIVNKLWNTAVNRLYYACYYAIIALLLRDNISVQTHSGVRQMFGLHYIKTGLITKDLGKVFSDLFDKRISGDYDDFIEITESDVISLFHPVKQLIHEVEKLLYAT
jgi:uncharacterized protein (UPF0332 family)